ncbi:A-kinase anchor protein 200 [Musca vetustissima]|uniref:A-kinase anchor protein 200 n=1 Tax=Musca vetustissima TaxID=27455 RepID=UPI002AB660FB|nr:A-kinase anchor protein 200 [Musca vetustissima]
MGKAQSKRSVDITTDNKKGGDEEVTEKLEKIEDVDKKDLNGDATVPSSSENNETNGEVENDKDMKTEKAGDGEDSGVNADDTKSQALETKNDDTTEELSPLSDECSKKSKKEKVKKKWSFRSISFGKKDKQKPGKAEEGSENPVGAVNGSEDDKNIGSTESQDLQTLTKNSSKETDKETVLENGNATETEINGEKSKDIKGNETDLKESTVENKDTSAKDSTIIKTSHETEELTKETNSDLIKNEKDDKEDSANVNDEKNDVPAEVESIDKQPTDNYTAEKQDIPASEANGTVDEIHQNGSNDVFEDEEKSKSQIEVNTNTGKNTSAETLESNSSSTPNTFPNDQNLNILDERSNDVGVESIEQKNCFDLKESGQEDETADKKIADETSPPPLPISPPPSQVSVFAFTNSTERVEESEKEIKTNPNEEIAEVNMSTTNTTSDLQINVSENENQLPVNDICRTEKVVSKEEEHIACEESIQIEVKLTEVQESEDILNNEKNEDDSLKENANETEAEQNNPKQVNEQVQESEDIFNNEKNEDDCLKENANETEAEQNNPKQVNEQVQESEDIFNNEKNEDDSLKENTNETEAEQNKPEQVNEKYEHKISLPGEEEACSEETDIASNNEIVEKEANEIVFNEQEETIATEHEATSIDKMCTEHFIETEQEIPINVDNSSENKDVPKIDELKTQNQENPVISIDSNNERHSDSDCFENKSTELLPENDTNSKMSENEFVAPEISDVTTKGGDTNKISNEMENLIGEESKDFTNPIDLKESTTEAEFKQDATVSCD